MEKSLAQDIYFMDLAVDAAFQSRYISYPNPNVGCVVTLDNQIIVVTYTQQYGSSHAEADAVEKIFSMFGEERATELLQQATFYVTLEPCSHFGKTPPCSDLLVKHQVKRVVIGSIDPNPEVAGKGIAKLDYANIKVTNLNYWRAKMHHAKFFHQFTESEYPFITVKIGMSLDASSALSNGKSKWITNQGSRTEVQGIRFTNQMILTTAATVIADNANYTLRYNEIPYSVKEHYSEEQVLARQPIVVIFDHKGKLDQSVIQNLNIFNNNVEKLVIYLDKHPLIGVEGLNNVTLNSAQNLVELLKNLKKNGTNYLMVEAGATLTSAILDCGLADQLDIFQSGKLLGHNSRSAIKSKELEDLDQAPEAILIHSNRIPNNFDNPSSVDLYNSFYLKDIE